MVRHDSEIVNSQGLLRWRPSQGTMVHGANESLQNFYKSQNKDIEKADETEIEQRQREIIDSDGLGLRPRIGIN